MKSLRTLARSGWIRAFSVGVLGVGLLTVPTSVYAASNGHVSNSASFTMGAKTTGKHLDNDMGSLVIAASKTQKNEYKATWTESELTSGNPVFLTGISGNNADSASGSLQVLAKGTATNGSAVVYFPISEGGTQTNPVTFEMHTTADLESLPTGQTPEVPWAAGLPLLAALPIAVMFLRRRYRAQ